MRPLRVCSRYLSTCYGERVDRKADRKQPFGSDDQKEAAISLPDHPDICVFMLDANQDLSKPCSNRGCVHKSSPQVLMGMVNSKLIGGDAYGGVTQKTFASR